MSKAKGASEALVSQVLPAGSPAIERASTHSRLNRAAPNYAYSRAVDEAPRTRPSLRELLGKGAATSNSPLARLAQALRNSRIQGADRVDAFTPDLIERTTAQIVAQSSAALVAQATFSQQSTMAVLKQL